MDEVWIENFRCFREEQRARLAPLTLLVGENSTGKTSFMAMVRALAEAAWGWEMPDFKESPYDLGSFDEIVNNGGRARTKTDSFHGGFSLAGDTKGTTEQIEKRFKYDLTFGRQGSSPSPIRRFVRNGALVIEETIPPDGDHMLRVSTSRGTWNVKVLDEYDRVRFVGKRGPALLPLSFLLSHAMAAEHDAVADSFEPVEGSPPIEPSEIEQLQELSYSRREFGMFYPLHASAPIRSQPRRTYEPTRVSPDPEGNFVPMYLASMQFENEADWPMLKARLEKIGKAAGLFDEIDIRFLNTPDVDPFQVQVRKFGNRRKGPMRNLVDMGYGVSQILPVVTEMLRPEAASMFLIQQPEVHLHPRAQAALGTLFCELVAGGGLQLIVETHSDHLIDRVRMEVRDGLTSLKPDDVSILYFERKDLDVKIHSIRIDENGNVEGAPDNYRRFFMEEVERSLWGTRPEVSS